MAAAIMAIVVVVPGALGSRLAQLRRLLDGADGGSVPPHIPLVGPFETEPSFLPLEQHLWQVCHGAAPFQIELGAPVVDAKERLLFCEITSGRERLAGLRAALLEGKYAPPGGETRYEPRCLVARLEPGADMALAEREAAATEAGAAFLLERIELMAQYPDGTWYERDFYTLDAAVAKT